LCRKFKIKFEIYLFLNAESEIIELVLPGRIYPAKLLLFGEYSVLEGASAIAFPLDTYSGKWGKGSLSAGAQDFFKFLKSFDFLDAAKIDWFLDQDFTFVSTIPVGYGLGSSGALSAACFDAFKNTEPESPELLQSKLAGIESYFHGQSSGLDPLCSYLDSCIIKTSDSVSVRKSVSLPGDLFLIDSGRSRSTAVLVELFKQKLEDENFEKAVLSLKTLGDRAIDALINDDFALFKSCFLEISKLQLMHFKEMIITDIEGLWKEGWASGDYFIKLSGAGGGGFYLGYGRPELNKNIIKIS